MNHETKFVLSIFFCAVCEALPVTVFLKRLVGVEMNVDGIALIVLSFAGLVLAINARKELEHIEVIP